MLGRILDAAAALSTFPRLGSSQSGEGMGNRRERMCAGCDACTLHLSGRFPPSASFLEFQDIS